MTHAIELTVTQKRSLTPSSVELTLAVPEELQTNFAYKAGQYLTLIQEIDHAESAGPIPFVLPRVKTLGKWG